MQECHPNKPRVRRPDASGYLSRVPCSKKGTRTSFILPDFNDETPSIQVLGLG